MVSDGVEIRSVEGAADMPRGVSEITPTSGRVDQNNFGDFRIVRMHEAPRVEVHIVDTGGEMGGIGEVGVPRVAPALCAALHQVSVKPIRRLPIRDPLA